MVAELLLYSWHVVDISVSEVDGVLTGEGVPRAPIRPPSLGISRKRRLLGLILACIPEALHGQGEGLPDHASPALLSNLNPVGGPGLYVKGEILRVPLAQLWPRLCWPPLALCVPATTNRLQGPGAPAPHLPRMTNPHSSFRSETLSDPPKGLNAPTALHCMSTLSWLSVYLHAFLPSGPRAPWGRNRAVHACSQCVAEAQPWDSMHWLNCTEWEGGASCHYFHPYPGLLTPALGTLFGAAFLGVSLLSLPCWCLAELGVKGPWTYIRFEGFFQGEAKAAERKQGLRGE